MKVEEKIHIMDKMDKRGNIYMKRLYDNYNEILEKRLLESLKCNNELEDQLSLFFNDIVVDRALYAINCSFTNNEPPVNRRYYYFCHLFLNRFGIDFCINIDTDKVTNEAVYKCSIGLLEKDPIKIVFKDSEFEPLPPDNKEAFLYSFFVIRIIDILDTYYKRR